MLSDFTPEMREKARLLSAEKRAADKAFAEANLRNDFADVRQWRRMASAYGIILPAWYVRNTRSIRRAAKKIGLDGTWVSESTGHASLKDLMEANPKWPSYAFIGLMLESVHDKAGNSDLAEVEDEIQEDEEDDLDGLEDEFENLLQ